MDNQYSRKESSENGLWASPTNLAPSEILGGEDYSLKASINGSATS